MSDIPDFGGQNRTPYVQTSTSKPGNRFTGIGDPSGMGADPFGRVMKDGYSVSPMQRALQVHEPNGATRFNSQLGDRINGMDRRIDSLARDIAEIKALLQDKSR